MSTPKDDPAAASGTMPSPAMVAAGLKVLDESQTFGYEPDGDLSREDVVQSIFLAMMGASR